MKNIHAASIRRFVRLATVAAASLALLGCGGGADESTVSLAEQSQSASVAGAGSMARAAAVTPTTIAGADSVKAVMRGEGWVSTSIAPWDTDAVGSTQARATTAYTPRFSGTGWYVNAESGSDQNPGTQERPWKTFEPTKKLNMQPGDALLLNCGSVWRDSLEITMSQARSGGILIGGYGDCSGGRRPVIRASDWVSPNGWAQVPGETRPIYAKSWAKPVQRLFNDGQPLIKARHPNYKGFGQEFLLAQTAISGSAFKIAPADLPALANKDLVGATVYVRVAAWQMDKATVTGFNPSTGLVTLDRASAFVIREGAGYLFEGKRWMLDTPGEWTVDEQTQELLWWHSDGRHPSTVQGLEASWRDKGLVAKWMPDVRIERIRTEQQNVDGFELLELPRLQVSDVESMHAYMLGISVLVSPDAVVENSYVRGAGRTGIIQRSSDGGIVRNNRVSDTGGFARASDSDAALTINGVGTSAENNIIERSAGLGLRFANRAGVQVRGNAVYESCLRLTDCSGIYTFTANAPTKPPTAYVAGAVVADNVIVGAKSNANGCATGCANLAVGIYLDELTSGVTLERNSVSDVEVGIGIHNAPYNTIRENTVKGASFAAFRGIQTRVDQQYLKGTRVLDNRFHTHRAMAMTEGVPAAADYSFGLYWFHAADPKTIFQASNDVVVAGNKLFHTQPHGDVHWGMGALKLGLALSRAEWKAYAPTDEQVSPAQHKYYHVVADGSSLLRNGQFNAAQAGSWFPYFSSSGTGGKFEMGEFAGCGKNCARFVAGATGDYLTSHTFNMNSTPGQNLYLLKFTAIGSTIGGSRKATVRRPTSPWESFGVNTTLEQLAPGQVDSVEQFFLARSSDEGVLDLRASVGGETLFRDVSLVRVASVEFPQRSKLSVHILNPSDNAKTFPCASVGLSSCDAVDENGAKVAWPVNVPAHGSKVLFARDAKWLN